MQTVTQFTRSMVLRRSSSIARSRRLDVDPDEFYDPNLNPAPDTNVHYLSLKARAALARCEPQGARRGGTLSPLGICLTAAGFPRPSAPQALQMHLSFAMGGRALREQVNTYFTNQALVTALLLTIVLPIVFNPPADDSLLSFFTLLSSAFLALGLFLYVVLLDSVSKLAGNRAIVHGIQELGLPIGVAQFFTLLGLICTVAAAVRNVLLVYTLTPLTLAAAVIAGTSALFFVCLNAYCNAVVVESNQVQLDWYSSQPRAAETRGSRGEARLADGAVTAANLPPSSSTT